MKSSTSTLTLIVVVSLAASITLISSCANKSQLSEKNAEYESKNEQLKTTVSPRTKLFIAEYQQELEKRKTNNSEFEVSKALIDKYSLVTSDGSVYVKGFATFNEAIDKKQLEDLGIKSGANFGGKTSLQIPVKQLIQFLNLSNIQYFEIAEKVQLKK